MAVEAGNEWAARSGCVRGGEPEAAQGVEKPRALHESRLSERRRLATLSGALQGVAERARLLALGSLAGLIAGLIVGGIGSRLAMRISFLAAGPAMAGVETEAGFTVGRVTAFGTLFFLPFVGSFVGVFGGAVLQEVCQAGKGMFDRSVKANIYNY